MEFSLSISFSHFLSFFDPRRVRKHYWEETEKKKKQLKSQHGERKNLPLHLFPPLSRIIVGQREVEKILTLENKLKTR